MMLHDLSSIKTSVSDLAKTMKSIEMVMTERVDAFNPRNEEDGKLDVHRLETAIRLTNKIREALGGLRFAEDMLIYYQKDYEKLGGEV